MKKITAGIIGIGFIGRGHVEALRRLGYVNIATASRGGGEEAKVLPIVAGYLCDWPPAFSIRTT